MESVVEIGLVVGEIPTMRFGWRGFASKNLMLVGLILGQLVSKRLQPTNWLDLAATIQLLGLFPTSVPPRLEQPP